MQPRWLLRVACSNAAMPVCIIFCTSNALPSFYSVYANSTWLLEVTRDNARLLPPETATGDKPSRSSSPRSHLPQRELEPLVLLPSPWRNRFEREQKRLRSLRASQHQLAICTVAIDLQFGVSELQQLLKLLHLVLFQKRPFKVGPFLDFKQTEAESEAMENQIVTELSYYVFFCKHLALWVKAKVTPFWGDCWHPFYSKGFVGFHQVNEMAYGHRYRYRSHLQKGTLRGDMFSRHHQNLKSCNLAGFLGWRAAMQQCLFALYFALPMHYLPSILFMQTALGF